MEGDRGWGRTQMDNVQILMVAVTTTKPFAWAHLKMTWPGVPPILPAMVASTVSRGPLGYVVIGLVIVLEPYSK
jgi:hypothetical protein